MKQTVRSSWGNRPVGQRQRMKPSTDRKAQILVASAELFSRKGYEKTSMKDIADEVGISKPALYHHLRSKHELLYTIMNDLMEFGIAGLQKIERMSIPTEEKIRLGIQHHLSSFDQYIAEYVVMLHEKTDWLPSSLERKIKRKFKNYTTLWDKLISEAIACKVIRPEIDPKILVWAILGMCNWVYKWYSREGRLSNPEIADIFYDIVSQGAFSKR
jgi:AcrR family transcriptional regulator